MNWLRPPAGTKWKWDEGTLRTERGISCDFLRLREPKHHVMLFPFDITLYVFEVDGPTPKFRCWADVRLFDYTKLRVHGEADTLLEVCQLAESLGEAQWERWLGASWMRKALEAGWLPTPKAVQGRKRFRSNRSTFVEYRQRPAYVPVLPSNAEISIKTKGLEKRSNE